MAWSCGQELDDRNLLEHFSYKINETREGHVKMKSVDVWIELTQQLPFLNL
jgi:hypothetical protein